MTVSYTGADLRLLLRWKGSLWKAVWLELLIFLGLYFAISGVYRLNILTAEQKNTFEYVATMFDVYTRRIPITYLLGFYVTAVVRRWWEQFQYVAWPDDILSYANVIFPGDHNLVKRRTISRWLNLTALLAWRDVSDTVRERFPSLDSIVHSGLMTREELNMYRSVRTTSVRWLIPLSWIQGVACRDMLDHNEVACTSPLVAHFLRVVNEYRGKFRELYCYDWVCLPLVYTQVAALAVYGFFAMCLIGRQYVDTSQMIKDHKSERRFEGREVDLVVPIFTIVEFIFYVGWLKVAAYLTQPFGDDDDDLELNYMLDRHLQTSMAIVDEVRCLNEFSRSERRTTTKTPRAQLPMTETDTSNLQLHPWRSQHVDEVQKHVWVDPKVKTCYTWLRLLLQRFYFFFLRYFQFYDMTPVIEGDVFRGQGIPSLPYVTNAKMRHLPPKLHTSQISPEHGQEIGDGTIQVPHKQKRRYFF